MGLLQTSISHMYPRTYSGVGQVYCNYCRTFLMTEAKRKTIDAIDAIDLANSAIVYS